MGADGAMEVCKREDWDREFRDVKPEDLGLYTGTVLGVDAVWGYHGDNLMDWRNYGDDFWIKRHGDNWEQDAPKPVQERRRAALQWFTHNHETHEVWT